jgi:hypothetical protein
MFTGYKKKEREEIEGQFAFFFSSPTITFLYSKD